VNIPLWNSEVGSSYSHSGMFANDYTDSSKTNLRFKSINAVADFVSGVIQTFECPTIPITVGEGATITSSLVSYVTTTSGLNLGTCDIRVFYQFYTVAGVFVGTITKLCGSVTYGDSVINLEIVGNDFTSINPDSRLVDGTSAWASYPDLGYNDYFVKPVWEIQPRLNAALLTTSNPIVTLSVDQPARKRYGFGPGTTVAYINGVSVGQAIIINAEQMTMHEPKPGLIAGFSPSPILFNQDLSQAIKTVMTSPDYCTLDNVYTLDKREAMSNTYEFWVDMMMLESTMNEECYSASTPDRSQDILDILNRFEAHGSNIPKASVSSFFKSAAKWVNKKIVRPFSKPIGKALTDTAQKFGSVGAKLIDQVADHLIDGAIMGTAAALTGAPTPAASHYGYSSVSAPFLSIWTN
jgi:hypothetical protein